MTEDRFIDAAVIDANGSVAFHKVADSPEAQLAFAREQIGGNVDLGTALKRTIEFAVGEWSLQESPANPFATSMLGRTVHGVVVLWGLTASVGVRRHFVADLLPFLI